MGGFCLLRLVPVILVTLLAFSPLSAAEAAADTSRIHSTHLPHVSGEVQVTGSWGAVALEGAPAEPVVLHADEASIRIIRATVTRVYGEGRSFSYDPDWTNETHDVSGAHVTFRTTSDAARAFAWTQSKSGFAGRITGPAIDVTSRELPEETAPWRYVYRMGPDSEFGFARALPAGTWTFLGGDAWAPTSESVTLTAPFALFITGGVLHTTERGRNLEFALHETRDEVLAPVGTSSVVNEEYAFAVLTVERGTLHAPMSTPVVRVAFGEPTFHVNGWAYFPDATGRVDTTRTARSFHAENLTLDGRFTLTPTPQNATLLAVPASLEPSPARTYHVSGEFERVQLDREVLENAWTGREVTLVATLIATITAAFTHTGRDALARVLLGLYTRITPPRVLDHPRRRQILTLIRDAPGVNPRKVQRLTGMAWGHFRYHLSVLEREDYVHRERHGHRVRLYSAGSHATRDDPMKHLNGRARDVLHAIPEGQSVTQKEVRARLCLSVQLVSYHLRRLEADGFVHASPGRPKRYTRTSALHAPPGLADPASPRARLSSSSP